MLHAGKKLAQKNFIGDNMKPKEAREIAEKAYGNSVDLVGEPAFNHCKRVAEKVHHRAETVAYLHDAFEDGLVKISGFPCEYTINGSPLIITRDQHISLNFLTSLKVQHYSEYIDELCELRGKPGEIAREVKLADIEDNMTRPCPESMLSMREPGGRYDKAKKQIEAAIERDKYGDKSSN